MPDFERRFGDYEADVEGSFRSAGAYTWLMLAGWVAFPFAVQTVLHPSDAAEALLRLQGQSRPEFMPPATVGAEMFALIMLATLCVAHFFVSVMFYRKAGAGVADYRVVPMYPVCGVLLGVIGNGLWWYFTGAFDPQGALIGFGAVALTVGCETLIDGRARNMAFGGGGAGF